MKKHRMQIFALFFSYILFFAQGIGCKTITYNLIDDSIDQYNKEAFVHEKTAFDPTRSLQKKSYPLITAFPELSNSLKMVEICDCPTPIQPLVHLEKELGAEQKSLQIYVKNDGFSNQELYGGNKVRKLELLFAQALHSGKNNILISGTVGSHSAAASAIYAKKLGLVPEIHLAPQIPSKRVRSNILALSRIISQPLESNSEEIEKTKSPIGSIVYHPSLFSAFQGIAWKAITTKDIFICPPGATSKLSTIAYINAMFELEQDIRMGKLPAVPKKIFVSAGSGGTFIGMYIGLQIIPIFHDTQLIAVSAGSKRPTGQYVKHFRDVVQYLRRLTNNRFPKINVSAQEIDRVLDRGFTGELYGKITPKSQKAKDIVVKDNLELELTYTAKTMARLIQDAKNYQSTIDSKNEIWVFWNTHSVETDMVHALHDPVINEQDKSKLRKIFNTKELERYDLND